MGIPRAGNRLDKHSYVELHPVAGYPCTRTLAPDPCSPEPTSLEAKATVCVLRNWTCCLLCCGVRNKTAISCAITRNNIDKNNRKTTVDSLGALHRGRVIRTCCTDEAGRPYRWSGGGEPKCIGVELETGKSEPA